MDGTTLEINFDSIASPSYNYEAAAPGNIASVANFGKVSNPQSVALEGLDKIGLLLDLGVQQAILPPLVRPNLDALYRIGLIKDPALRTALDTRSLASHLSRALYKTPHLLAACFSGASFWTNNSATVFPSADTADDKVHLTPANMISSFHRSLESHEILFLFRQVFESHDHFVIHDPLPCCDAFGDEGAANHLRFGLKHEQQGLNVFVYGRNGFNDSESWPLYRPRQTLAACEAISRLHCLDLDHDRTLFFKQNQEAIRAGIFHNDVISVNNLDLFLYHEQTFDDTPRAISDIGGAFYRLTGKELRLIEVKSSQISLREVAASYLFNSQLVRNQNGETVLLSPQNVSVSLRSPDS
jgi:succinylarginine dihydrolase